MVLLSPAPPTSTVPRKLNSAGHRRNLQFHYRRLMKALSLATLSKSPATEATTCVASVASVITGAPAAPGPTGRGTGRRQQTALAMTRLADASAPPGRPIHPTTPTRPTPPAPPGRPIH